MLGNVAKNQSIESYITSRGTKGYYLLASDDSGYWYWAYPRGDDDDHAVVEFLGPYASRGEAITAGENWIEASEPVSGP